MRAKVATLVALLLLVSTPAGSTSKGWAPDMRAAIRYARARTGSISFAVKAPRGPLYAHRGHHLVPAASVLKVMFMTAYLRQSSVRDHHLRERDKRLLAPMIRWSDNRAATRVADQLRPRRMYRLARDARMRHFRYTRPWGLSSIDAAEQARFLFHLERYIPNRHEDYARYLLSHIVRRQQWGVARVHKPNWELFFKSGWGSGTGAVSHQVAFLERGKRRIALAIMTENSPSLAYSTDTLRGIAKRLLSDLP